MEVPSPEQAADRARLDAELAREQAELERPDPAEAEQRAAFLAGLTASDGAQWAASCITGAESTGGATLAAQPDGSVLASGENPATDEHIFTLRTNATGLRLLLVEALTDPSLPGSRVGRAPNGNAVLTGVTAEAISVGDPARRQPVDLVWAWADHEQASADHGIVNALDPSDDLGWAVAGHEKEGPRAALLLAEQTFGFDGAVAGREPSAAPPAAEPEFPDVPPPDASAIAAIRAELGHVEPLAAGANALRVELAAIAPTVDAARAARLLEPLREQIVDLSLARAAIDDATIALLARMPNLVRLDLRRTRVTDAGLARLGAHPRLETLVLAGSAVTDAAVETLRGMSALRRVYLWGSCMTGDGTARLRALRPDLLVDAGDVPDATPLETSRPSRCQSAPLPRETGVQPVVHGAGQAFGLAPALRGVSRYARAWCSAPALRGRIERGTSRRITGESNHDGTGHLPEEAVCHQGRAGNLCLVRVRPVTGAAVLRRQPQGDGARAARGQDRRARRGRMVRVQGHADPTLL